MTRLQSKRAPTLPAAVSPPVKALKRAASEDAIDERTVAKKAKTDSGSTKTDDVKGAAKIKKDDEEKEVEDWGDEDEEDEEGEREIPRDVQNRLDQIDGMVSSLSKMFLKSVMKEVGVYAGGSNKVMAAQIVACFESRARNGNDLKYELKVARRVHRDCWGGCVGDEEEEEEEDKEDEEDNEEGDEAED